MGSLNKSSCRNITLTHPSGINPGDLLDFLYLGNFESEFADLYPGDRDEVALSALEVMITMNPQAGAVVGGTGGLRKLRFAAESENRGKRGACRVCYAYIEEHHLVVMITVYAKNEKDDLSAAEKAGIKAYLEFVKQWFDKRARGNDR